MITETLSSLIRLVKTLIPSCLSALSSLKTRADLRRAKEAAAVDLSKGELETFLMDSP